MLDFSGEVALITGGGQGLGRAYALALAARGAHVVVNDLGDAAHRVAEEIVAGGGAATAAVGSVVDDAEAIVAGALAAKGRLDIVVNNAGVTGGGPFHLIPPAEWDRVIAVQLGGTVNVSRAAWPHLAAAGRGRLLNTSSAAVFGAPFTSQYAGAKGAIFALTRAWAGEGEAAGIRVNCVMPSAITAMTEQIPDPAFLDFLSANFPPGSVAEFVAWLVHRDTALNGETFSVGGGRAARVVLAQAAGVALGDAAAESWAGREAELLRLGDVGFPLSLIEEVAFQARNLGGAAQAAFAAIDRENAWGA